MDNCITTATRFSYTIQFDEISNVKTQLMEIIDAIIKRNSWVQAEAARILKISQSNVSNIKPQLWISQRRKSR